MKNLLKKQCGFWILLGVIVLLISCKNNVQNNSSLEYAKIENTNEVTTQKVAPQLSQEFKDYWYAGQAEISSYQLQQARYGELHQGKAVLIFVTEDFEKTLQVKADYSNPANISVLKLNATKTFNTGIYPYSTMQSTFHPVSNDQHAIKVSCSVQEWCGHVYMQLNNKKQFEVTSHSYFQNEADENFKLNKTILENELWTQLRISPKRLPTGTLQIVPSFEFCRLRHKPVKAYKAIAQLKDNTYTITYPELNRTLQLTFNSKFPYDIEAWEETYLSGFGANAKTLTTKATKLKTIKSSYWNKNKNVDEVLRQTLLLE